VTSSESNREDPWTDVASNRAAVKYDSRELIGRAAWAIAGSFFRASPRPLFAWRRFLLRLFGARIGREVHIYPSVRIFMPWNLEVGDWSSVGEDALIYNLGRVSLGARVTVSHRAHLCAGTHDHRDPVLPLLKPPIRVADDAWIAAAAFVGPGVTIGQGAVVGAAAVVVRDVAAWKVVGGNPARVIGTRNRRERAE
jgi:putative colanic acid biosynthesis acetyltransferase WcaF